MKKLSLLFFVAVVSIAFSACGDSSDSKDKSSENLGESAQKDLPKDFIVNCNKCIMAFALGNETIKQLKQEVGEENFYAMADGMRYDMRQTQNYAVANGIEFIYIKDSDIFQAFVIADKKVQIQNYFGYYLYKKGDKIEYFPDIAHDEINEYFGITNPKDSQDSIQSNAQSSESSADSTTDSSESFMAIRQSENAKRIVKAIDSGDTNALIAILEGGGKADIDSGVKIVANTFNNYTNAHYDIKMEMTPLFYATYKENIAMIEILLRYGANVDELGVDIEGELYYSPLFWAAEQGSDENYEKICRLLIANGADADFVVMGGVNVIQHIVARGNFELTKLLLEKGANPNFADLGSNAFEVAVKKDNFDIAKLLLENGANVNVQDDECGYRALDYAKSEKMKELLLQYGAIKGDRAQECE